MPRKAARDGLPGGPVGAWGRGWAWRGLGAWVGQAGPGAWVGGTWGHGWAARGATHSPHTVAHGGIAPIEPRHADDTQ